MADEEKTEEPKPVLRDLGGAPAEGTEDATVEQDVNPVLLNDPREIPVEEALEQAGHSLTRPDGEDKVVVEEKEVPLGEEENKTDIAEGTDRAAGDEEE